MSRFGLAIPALILDDYRVGQSMFRSDELTERKWLILAALVGKCTSGATLQECLRSGWHHSFHPIFYCPPHPGSRGSACRIACGSHSRRANHIYRLFRTLPKNIGSTYWDASSAPRRARTRLMLWTSLVMSTGNISGRFCRECIPMFHVEHSVWNQC
jgi:hypothetical protein